MYEFKQLQFNSSPTLEGKEAHIFFPNGWGAIVAGGPDFEGDGLTTFDLTVIQGSPEDYQPIFYNPLCEIRLTSLTNSEVEENLNDIATFIPL